MDNERVERPDPDEELATAANSAPLEPPEPAVTPGAGDAAAGDPPTAEEPATPSPPAPGSATRRVMKLVVTLRPGERAGYRAVLALGADGCDPLLRSAEVGDLQAALDEVPGLVAEAEARWAAQPRNPAARPARAARATAPSRPPTAATAPAAARPAAADSAEPAAAPAEPAGAGQLSFFG